MIAHYGIPYLGSKDKIAPDILRHLPDGKRFCDLFGGGFAMSHAALLSGKYERVYYNELNSLLVELIRKACAGEYSYKRFKPKFISRDQFEQDKEKDGYVKYIWSFGNSGKNYLFGKDVEPIKKQGHDYCIFGKSFDGFPVIGKDPMTRRINLRRLAGERIAMLIKQHPELKSKKRSMEATYELQQLERLERLERLEIRCGSYLEYKHLKGDVVYCDPPYEDTMGYSPDGFDHQRFYDWVASRKFPVYFSSFSTISDKRFKMIYAIKKRNLGSGAKEKIYNYEALYFNGQK